ncbi:MAG: hypothetical protein JSU63_18235 [Phycisphaerales bacterium]|nr:MAG: hypothetical protein JSU63_18235 [Phycisphaerales bacterium]
MQKVKTKGLSLSGKARRRHKAGRAARLFDQQLILDYFDPNDASSQRPAVDRSIPVMHHRDSHTAAGAPFQPVAKGADAQVDRRADANETDNEEAICFVRAGKTTIGGTPAVRSAHSTQNYEPEAKTATDPLSTNWTSWRARPPKRGTSSTRGFTLGGFLYGCAMGAAAAGLMLVVLQAAIG